eukprot:Gb_02958 [translate_table: standard]
MTGQTRAYRASVLHSVGDPAEVGIDASCQYFEDGLLVIQEGEIKCLGHARDLVPTLPPGTQVTSYGDALIIPGFIDTHIHFPQTDAIASYGHQLLDWLNNHIFPAESRFADKAHASKVADLFLDQLLRNGITTALVFATVHKHSVDALFEAAERLNLRMISGKVLMDRNAPEPLTDTPESGYAQSKELIDRWHGKGRLSYAITPRFAPTCSGEQLKRAGELLAEHPSVYMHTHLSENPKEVELVSELFPERRGYLDVYDHYGLVGPRSVFAHGVHLTDEECVRLAETGSAVAFCPTSNLFLGSGFMNLPKLEHYKVNVGVGTDVGGGTSFSMLQTLNEAYKVMQMQGHSLHPFKSLYLATLGGARALRLEDRVGSFAPGNEADFIVLDFKATPLIDYRLQLASSLEEKLFVLMMLGDDRAIKETFAAGQSVHRR